MKHTHASAHTHTEIGENTMDQLAKPTFRSRYAQNCLPVTRQNDIDSHSIRNRVKKMFPEKIFLSAFSGAQLHKILAKGRCRMHR